MGCRKREKTQTDGRNNDKESDKGKTSNKLGSKQQTPTTKQTLSETKVNKKNPSHTNNAGKANLDKEDNNNTHDDEKLSSDKKKEKDNSTQDAERHLSINEKLHNEYLRSQGGGTCDDNNGRSISADSNDAKEFCNERGHRKEGENRDGRQNFHDRHADKGGNREGNDFNNVHSRGRQDYRDEHHFRDGRNYCYERNRRDVGGSQDERGRREYRDRQERDERNYRDGRDYRDARDYRNRSGYYEGPNARYGRNDHRPYYHNRRPYGYWNRFNDRPNFYDASHLNLKKNNENILTIHDRKDKGNEAVLPNTICSVSTVTERSTQLEKKVGQVEKTVYSMYQMMKYGAHQPLIPVQMHHPAIPIPSVSGPPPTMPASAPSYIALIPPSSISQSHYGLLQSPAEAQQMQLTPTLGNSLFPYGNSALGRSALTPYQLELLRHNFI